MRNEEGKKRKKKRRAIKLVEQANMRKSENITGRVQADLEQGPGMTKKRIF
jgi:hypothetical protein